MNFRNAQYLVSAARYDQCPPDEGVEVAFAGRSNAGKSSTLNALTGQRNLARTSKTPGRTQLLNFFTVTDDVRLVDLPGFGYAKVPTRVQQAWNRTLDHYFRGRESLQGLVLVSDIRHEPSAFEQQLLDWCSDAGLPVLMVLNKADKLSRNQVAQTVLRRRKVCGSANSALRVIAFSALKKQGLDELRAAVTGMLHAEQAPGEKNPDPTGE